MEVGKTQEKTIIAITGLVCLTALQLYAWYSGHNGVVFASTSALFGGIIGYFFKASAAEAKPTIAEAQ